LTHRASKNEGVSSDHPDQVEVIETSTELTGCSEVTSKVDLFGIESDVSEVAALTFQGPRSVIREKVKRIQDDSSAAATTDEIAQYRAIATDSIGTQVELHGQRISLRNRRLVRGEGDRADCNAAQISGICKGKRVRVMIFFAVMSPGRSPNPVMAIWTLPGSTAINSAALVGPAHLARLARPAAQTSSTIPLT
jgi:hypothetical protein